MLRAVLDTFGLTNKSTVVHNPFSSEMRERLNRPEITQTKPLDIKVVYPSQAAVAALRNRLFEEQAQKSIKQWLSTYFSHLGLDLNVVKLTQHPFKQGEQFIGFQHDQLLNGQRLVYPRQIIEQSSAPCTRIREHSESKKNPLGVLELKKNSSYWKILFPNHFCAVLIPHSSLKPLGIYRHSLHENGNCENQQAIHRNR